jgi:MIP family channel proteins
MYRLPQKLAAEFFGTFGFIFIASCSICADQYLHSAGQPTLGTLGIALAQGLAYAVAVTSVAHISGGHLNPAVTVGCWVTKRIGTLQGIFYCVAQLLGSIAAAYLLSAVIPDSVWRPVALGAPSLSRDIGRLHGMIFEAALAAFLVFVLFATTIDPKGALQKAGGFATGLTVTISVLAGYPFTGTALNPARAFGPALAARHWENQGVYWVGPLFGGIVAAFLYDRCFLTTRDPASAGQRG